MEKKYFALYLNPPRKDFAQTMSTEERNIMQQHVAYWKKYSDEGVMIVFGPTQGPDEVYGLGIIAVDSEEQLVSLLNDDPASRINSYEYHSMIRAVVTSKIRP